jgi:site-specific recombinase XerD
MQRLLGTDSLGAKTLDLLTAAWAKSTSDTYNSAIKPYFKFCEEQGLPPLAATTTTMARNIAWIGERGTTKATSLQPYLSAMNGFFKDHGAEPVAQGDLVAKVRRGLVASQVSLPPSLTRMYMQAQILVSSLSLAKDLRTHMIETWTHAQTDLIILFRACLATVLLTTFFVAGERELSAGL